MAKNVLNFKLEFSEKEDITPYAGLGIYGELYRALGIDKEIDRIFPEPGSGKGYKADTYINPLVMMLLGGGRHIEDIRKIKADEGLKEICKMEKIPSADAIGDWLRNSGKQKAEYIKIINDNLSIRILKRAEQKEMTLDIDATEIEANKREAKYTYNGNKGYMPLLGFIPEMDLCIGYEFREGNKSPGERNYEFTKEIIEFVKRQGKRIARFRSDSAAYQANVLNFANAEGIRYTITADKDEAVKERISGIKEWKQLKDSKGINTDREYGEFIHSMNKTNHSFRAIVLRWLNPEQDLLKETSKYCYHCIATNYTNEEKNSEEVVWWHNGRSNSENYNKELKLGFNLEYMPCGEFQANAVWFGIGILAYNLFIASKIFLFPKNWIKKTIRTIRWQIIQIAGKVVKRARQLILRICTLRETYEIFEAARIRCRKLQAEGI